VKKTSVKLRITLWLTLLTAALAVTLLLFLLSISSRVLSQNAREGLIQTMRDNLPQIHMTEGGLSLGEDFHFHKSGVNTLIYSKNKTLLAGQIPVSFTTEMDFENGVIRSAELPEGHYLLLDMWLAEGWEDGLWVRGIIEVPEREQTERTMLRLAAVVLPGFLLMAALGAYFILRRAFRPLQSISDTALAINDGEDLSRRIGLPEGRDEFTRLAGTFDRLLERLERSFEAEKQFTADASHELRTPVSIIKGACEYARKYGETEQERQETIAMIERQADKMALLISQLLSMTRLEQGTEQMSLQLLDLSLLAEQFCAQYAAGPGRLLFEAGEGLPVLGDETLLVRLMQNLVDNAFKYGGESGSVKLWAFSSGDRVCLSVSDEGPGIAPEEQEKIWQRFYQTDPSHGEKSGAGLGLALVRQIARLHGGEMALQSRMGEGSVFTLTLPRAKN